MRDEITFAGITFDVEYYIEKGEKRTYDYPGSLDRVELEEITCGGFSFYDLLYEHKKEIEEIIYYKLY
jgi:hypothetical protein